MKIGLGLTVHRGRSTLAILLGGTALPQILRFWSDAAAWDDTDTWSDHA